MNSQFIIFCSQMMHQNLFFLWELTQSLKEPGLTKKTGNHRDTLYLWLAFQVLSSQVRQSKSGYVELHSITLWYKQN